MSNGDRLDLFADHRDRCPIHRRPCPLETFHRPVETAAGFSLCCCTLPHVAPHCRSEPISRGVNDLSLAGTCRVLLEVAASCGAQKARKRQRGTRRVDATRACGVIEGVIEARIPYVRESAVEQRSVRSWISFSPSRKSPRDRINATGAIQIPVSSGVSGRPSSRRNRCAASPTHSEVVDAG